MKVKRELIDSGEEEPQPTFFTINEVIELQRRLIEQREGSGGDNATNTSTSSDDEELRWYAEQTKRLEKFKHALNALRLQPDEFQLLVPAAINLVSSPVHLLGLSLYNNPGFGALEHVAGVAAVYVSVTVSRVMKGFCAYGLGGVSNTALRAKFPKLDIQVDGGLSPSTVDAATAAGQPNPNPNPTR